MVATRSEAAVAGIAIALTHPTGSTDLSGFQPFEASSSMLYVEDICTSSAGDWELQMTSIPEALRSVGSDRLDPEAIEDISVVLYYTIG